MSNTRGARSGAVAASQGTGAVCDRYAGVVFDVDGVVLHLEDAIPGAAETIAELRSRGISVAFVTNNASRTPDAVAEALRATGVDAKADDVVTSSVAAADMLEPGTRCLVIGMDGLVEALRARGCDLVHEPDEAEAVVVGWDRELVWDDLRRASLALSRGARFIATNADASYPTREGPWPGNGATIAALSTATGREPEVAGKPEPQVFRTAARRLGCEPLLMVGDRPDTDLVGASALGWDTALVLTGVTEAADGVHPRPTWVFDDLHGLLEPAPSDPPAGPLVRVAADADVPAILELWQQGHVLYNDSPNFLAAARHHDPDLVLIADVDGRPVGVILATFDGTRGWLKRLAVHPDHRRQGLGRQLVDEAERRLATRGARRISIHVFADNEPARAFWARLGYRHAPDVTFWAKGL